MTDSTIQDQLAVMQAQIKLLSTENASLKARPTKAPVKRKPIAKITDKGGLYFSAPKMLAFSEAKQKEYICGINIHAYQLQAFHTFLSDPSLIKMVLDAMGSTKQVS